MIYCNILSRGAGQAFRAKVNARAKVHRRDPDTIKLAPGLVAIVGSTREEALRKHELYSGAGSEDGLIAQFAREHGIEPRGFDADTPLNFEDFIPAQDRIAAVGFTQGLVELLRHETLTARQVIRRSAGNHRLVLGTAEQVADQIIDLWADGTVDAYTYQPPRAPDDIREFVDCVVPILRDRGVYRATMSREKPCANAMAWAVRTAKPDEAVGRGPASQGRQRHGAVLPILIFWIATPAALCSLDLEYGLRIVCDQRIANAEKNGSVK